MTALGQYCFGRTWLIQNCILPCILRARERICINTHTLQVLHVRRYMYIIYTTNLLTYLLTYKYDDRHAVWQETLASRCIHAFILRFTFAVYAGLPIDRWQTEKSLLRFAWLSLRVQYISFNRAPSECKQNWDEAAEPDPAAAAEQLWLVVRGRLDYRQNGRSLYRHRANDDDCSDKVRLAGRFLDPLLRRLWLHLRQISGGTNTVGVPGLHVALYIAYLYPIPAVHIVNLRL